jgi:hypothetical protein
VECRNIFSDKKKKSALRVIAVSVAYFSFLNVRQCKLPEMHITHLCDLLLRINSLDSKFISYF